MVRIRIKAVLATAALLALPTQSCGALCVGAVTPNCSDPANNSPLSSTSTSSSTNTVTSAQAGASIAGQTAGVAGKMTGNASDSQADVMANSQNLNTVSSGGSRVAGTLDTLEGLLLLPLHPWDAGKFLFSGQQAQKAADQLEKNSNLSGASSGKMVGIGSDMVGSTSTSATGGTSATGASVNGTGSSSASSADAANASSAAYGSDRAQDLFQQLESSYGVNRDEFVSAAIQTKGNPGAIGDFMQEKTGNPKLGRDAAMAAMDSYTGSPNEGGTYVAAAVPERTPASANNANASGASTLAGGLSLGSNVDLGSKAAKKAEEEKSLRDRMKKAMAERMSAGSAPGSLADSAESLQPLREGLFQQAADAEDDGQTLFDVIHTKYTSLTNRMRPKTAVFSH